ncbi:MAG: ATP-binding protein [Bacteroidales bacterium]
MKNTSIKKLKILLIITAGETDQFAEEIKKLISENKWEFHIKNSLQETLNNVALKKQYDIALIVTKPTVFESQEITKAIKKITTQIPVIVIEDEYNKQQEQKSLEAGAYDYITKNILTADLLKRSIKFGEIVHTEVKALRERTKELNCMYQIGKILEQKNLDAEITLQKITDIIPQGFQYPEITCVRINIDGKSYKTRNFYETEWKLYTTINSEEKIFGSVEVFYMGKKINTYGEFFLREEKYLINEISIIIAKFIENHKSQHALKENEEKYRNLFNSSRDAILVADTERNIIDANPAAEELFGYKIEEIQGKKTQFLYDTSDEYKKMGEWLKQYYNNGFFNLIRYKKKDNNSFYGETNACYLKNSNGEVIGFVGLIRDITEHLEAEKAIKEQNEEYEALNEELKETNERIKNINEELQISKEKAEESIRLKNAFLANMSHEIRTPMNGIIGFANLIKDNKHNPEKMNEFVDIIEERSHSLLSLLDDIIDLSKIDARQLKIEENKCSLNILMDNLYDIFQQELNDLEKENIALSVHKTFTNGNDIIISDESRIKQILSNLIKNAIKFTPEGEIEIGYNLRNLDTLIFYVKDTGIGIPQNKKEEIFERFRQLDDSITRKYGGTGLGLAITKELLHYLGGEIWVESEENKGSTFYFTIPYKKSEESIQPISKTTEKSISYNWQDKRILIIEDDLASTEYLKEVLSDTKAEIITAGTGEEGYQQYCVHKKDLRVILMDIRLPDISGLEITKKIRQENPKIPILAQSAYAMKNDKISCINAGCNEYITKPIPHKSLLEILNQYMNGDNGSHS